MAQKYGKEVICSYEVSFQMFVNAVNIENVQSCSGRVGKARVTTSNPGSLSFRLPYLSRPQGRKRERAWDRGWLLYYAVCFVFVAVFSTASFFSVFFFF